MSKKMIKLKANLWGKKLNGLKRQLKNKIFQKVFHKLV